MDNHVDQILNLVDKRLSATEKAISELTGTSFPTQAHLAYALTTSLRNQVLILSALSFLVAKKP
jgi:hypothetical protein